MEKLFERIYNETHLKEMFFGPTNPEYEEYPKVFCDCCGKPLPGPWTPEELDTYENDFDGPEWLCAECEERGYK